eukprot:m.4138 g.4138  ORF g.4138 m.4138 type:complete len:761 (+) comp6723_c0_seq2:1-2283(+)
MALSYKYSLYVCFLLAGLYHSTTAASVDGHCTTNSSASLHLSNPNLNVLQLVACTRPLNSSKLCDANSTVVCDSLQLYPGNVTLKYYFPARPTALAARPWSNEPFSYRPLPQVPSIPFFSLSSTSVTLPLLAPNADKQLYCQTDADCPNLNGRLSKGSCQPLSSLSSLSTCRASPTPPPPPPSKPLPPVPMPAASACNLTGNWSSESRSFGYGSEAASYTISMMSDTTFAWTCHGRATPCLGDNPKTGNGTGTLSNVDNTITIIANQTYHGILNNTYACNIISLFGLAYPVAITSKQPHPPPAFNLDVTAATFLGSTQGPLSIAAVTIMSSNTIVVAANGDTDHLSATPTLWLNGSKTSNASLIFLKQVDTLMQPATGLSVLRVVKLGERVDHIASNTRDQALVAGSWGLAGVQLADLKVLWVDDFTNLRPSPLGRCLADGDLRCRTSIGQDGTAAALVPTGAVTLIMSYSSDGKRLGQFSLPDSGVTDVAVDSSTQRVHVTWSYDSNTGHEPMVMPAMEVLDYRLSTQAYRLWPWSAHVYRSSGPCNGDVADSRAERVVIADNSDFIFVGRSDGGNGAFYCQDRDSNRTAAMISYDQYTSAYNMQAQAISFFGNLDSKTGQVQFGQYNLVRLTSTGGNTLRTVGAAGDDSHRRYFAQTAACCIENMANLTVNGQTLSGPADAAVLQITNPTYTQRLVWHHFTAAGGRGSQDAVDVQVRNQVVAMAINSASPMVQVAPIPNTGLYSNGAEQGYLVVLPTI